MPTEEEACKALMMCNSYSRLPGLMSLRGKVPDKTWLRLLGRFWSVCDNVSDYTIEILEESPVAATWAPIQEMMTFQEQEALGALPDEFMVYRGCYDGVNEHGISYTLD